MSKFKTDVTVKQIKGQMFNVYLKGVPVWYAKVLEPVFKYQSTTEKEYALTAFIDADTFAKIDKAHGLSKEFVTFNKSFKQVGVDKNKNRKVKFPLASQIDDEEKKQYGYDSVDKMYGCSLSLKEVSSKGKPNTLTIIGKPDAKGRIEPFKGNIGNGSVCNIKLFGYVNKEGMLNIQLDTIQVLEHVPYTGVGAGGEIMDDEFGGSYTRGAAPEATVSDDTFTEDEWND